ncbi:hypothetical protein PU629_17020 [Pullulanibacillus sp. KACC 23026]|uniref:hypothetical protein n=1 Tax=Pullulanibacillus sp. KACC 23026 TaxID=3028315 RepID=UPI0023B1E3DD|nr:hypothetical protein [Pullulanibacillus sp. KACC 23026]WEG11821.1 hypothetical protein PU629_17020 [Pullulanibacillus sp. KACC 23026]
MVTDTWVYEQLGIRPRLRERFYVPALIQFYQEKQQGLSEKEKPFFNQSLKLFLEYLETVRATSWEACDQKFWEKLFTFSFLDLSYSQSAEQVRAFFQVIGQFTVYLDNQNSRDLHRLVEDFIEKVENDVLDAVRLLDSYHQKVEQPFATGIAEIEREALLQEVGSPISEGVFVLKDKTESAITAHHLLTRNEYVIALSPHLSELMHDSMSLIGVLKEASNTTWEILVLDRAFPTAALPFVKEAVGVS